MQILSRGQFNWRLAEPLFGTAAARTRKPRELSEEDLFDFVETDKSFLKIINRLYGR